MGKHVDRIKNAINEAKGVIGKIDIAKDSVVVEITKKLEILENTVKNLAESIEKLQEKLEKINKSSDKKVDKKADKQETKKADKQETKEDKE